MDKLVEFIGVSKAFNGKPAVKRLSLEIMRGEFIAVMGPSGCGKTTALRMLAGFDIPDEGDIFFDGERINDLKPWQRNVPMVWQNLALFPFLNVLENVEFGLKMHGIEAKERKERAMRWLEKLHIGDFAAHQVNQLSGGQRQRVALARTLVTEPDILLLDEPLSALDANMVTHMQGVLSDLQKSTGITFLYVTHSRAEAFAMADRIVVMNDGGIRQIGSPAEIYQRPRDGFVARFVGDSNIFSGELLPRENGALSGVLRTPDGDLSVKEIPATAVAGAAEVAVNVGDIVISATPQEMFENTVKCVLESESFAGDSILLRLKTPAGTVLVVKMRAGTDKCPEIRRGASLFAQWHADKTRLLDDMGKGSEPA